MGKTTFKCSDCGKVRSLNEQSSYLKDGSYICKDCKQSFRFNDEEITEDVKAVILNPTFFNNNNSKGEGL